MNAEPRIVIYADRLALVGATGSGKSTLARYLFEQARCRRLLVDSKHSWRVRGVEPTYNVADVDWRAPLVHFRPRWLDRDQADELYGAAFRRLRHAFIWTDEATGVSASNWPGTAFAAIQSQGRELEIGHAICSQRPVNVRREAWTEATHLLVFRDLDDDDLRYVRAGIGFLSLDELRRLVGELPEHGCVWVDRRQRRVAIVDPLPERLRRPSLVTRTKGAE